MRKIAAAVLAFFVVAFVGWKLTYPSETDPKNIRYLLWKAGASTMNLDSATATMIGDPNREKLVVGRTKAELRKRFGYLQRPADVGPYLRNCYQTSSWNNQEVLFIRSSPWMVVFEDDRAVELILVKGC